MAISSKINIDVDSAAFASFQEKFNKYKAALDATPAAWRGVGTAVAKSKTAIEAFVVIHKIYLPRLSRHYFPDRRFQPR
jgi:hypothetical protein